MPPPTSPSASSRDLTWPSLPLSAWSETLDTLHLWTQIVGKIKLELTPFLNEWWNVALFVMPRGLTTGPIPFADLVFAIDFDFVDHALTIHTSDGTSRTMPLIPRSVAAFYHELMAMVQSMGIVVTINTLPVELVNPIRFEIDDNHDSYDPAAVQRWWRIMLQTSRVLQVFRSAFMGKNSPIHFFWGSFDLAHTRFSGRPAPLPGGPPFFQLAEDQENYACGFWPGQTTFAGLTLGEPAFYAYAYPAPAGLAAATVRPGEAFFHAELGEFILPYEAVRRAQSPERAILGFFQSTYEAAATLGGWDRAWLERDAV